MANPLQVTAPEGLPFIDTEREFDAPVAAVFAAHRDPDLVRRWLGPHGYEMEVERWDFASQGGYRYVHRDPDGNAYAFNGVFHVVRDNEFVVQTFEFEGVPDVVSVESLTFTDLGGRCRLTGHAVFPALEARDGILASGMEQGLSEGFDRLDQLVANDRASGGGLR